MKGSALPRASASNVLGRDRHESPVKVLAVDDRSENLFTIQTTLKRLPVEVVTADSGEAALRATLRHANPPDTGLSMVGFRCVR